MALVKSGWLWRQSKRTKPWAFQVGSPPQKKATRGGFGRGTPGGGAGESRPRPGQLIPGWRGNGGSADLRKGRAGPSATRTDARLRARGWTRSRTAGQHRDAPLAFLFLPAFYNFKPPGHAAPDPRARHGALPGGGGWAPADGVGSRGGPSPPPHPARLHPAPLEEKLVRPLLGWQLGLLPRRDAARHGRPHPRQIQLPGRQDRPWVRRWAEPHVPQPSPPRAGLSTELWPLLNDALLAQGTPKIIQPAPFTPSQLPASARLAPGEMHVAFSSPVAFPRGRKEKLSSRFVLVQNTIPRPWLIPRRLAQTRRTKRPLGSAPAAHGRHTKRLSPAGSAVAKPGCRGGSANPKLYPHRGGPAELWEWGNNPRPFKI